MAEAHPGEEPFDPNRDPVDEELDPGAKVPDDLLRREIAELGRLLHGS